MLVQAHPGRRLEVRRIGAEGAPLLVIDQAVADPDRLVRKAARGHFSRQGAMYPGLRLRAPLSYEVMLEGLLRPLLESHFGLPGRGRFVFPMCHYSLVTTPPEQLAFLQRVPHIDSVSAQGLATVHYLFRGGWGGTDFYRHRRTGFEYIDESRHATYFHCLAQQGREASTDVSGYIDGDTAEYERIADVEGVFNRLVVYRRNSLHSGRIDNGRPLPADPLQGRLSINAFIDIVR